MSTKNECEILAELYRVVLSRRRSPQQGSYVCSLLNKGPESIQAKIIEEAGEVVKASAQGSSEQFVHEMADLWFHCLVLLGFHEIEPAAVCQELIRRRNR
jgi:phosphoribosyl-ATP pyrophosphohydrolase/phosphoribosyl-AMP cyclohydrolase